MALLVMGLGMQLIGWPDDFVQALVDAGYRVVRHDNRDIGLSQGFDEAGAGNLLWQSVRQRIGLPVRSAVQPAGHGRRFAGRARRTGHRSAPTWSAPRWAA